MNTAYARPNPTETANAVRDIPTVPGTPFGGGYYVDRITADGKTYALVVAPQADDEGKLTWKQALKRASACRAGGFDDWQLPSRRDALAIAEKLLPTGSATPDAFREGGEQAFARAAYWTGAEVDGEPGYAWLQSFDHGYHYNYSEYYRFRVRAVRKCPL